MSNHTSVIASNTAYLLSQSTSSLLNNTNEDNGMILIYVDKVGMWIQVISIILSYLGNLLVIYASTRTRRLPLSKMMLNYLAVCDLVYSTFQILLVHRRFNNHEWVFGPVVCKLSKLYSVAIISSIFIVTLIAVERHRSILYPFRIKLRKRRSKLYVALLCVFAVILSFPSSLRMKIVEHENGKKDCSRDWPGDDYKYWNLVVFIFTYPSPLIIIGICYLRVVNHITMRPEILSNVQPITTYKRSRVTLIQKLNRHRKMITMLTTIVVTFMITTTPNQIMILWLDFGETTNKNARSIYTVFLCLSVFVHFHPFMNPIIYCISDPKFRHLITNRHQNDRILRSENNTITSPLQKENKFHPTLSFIIPNETTEYQLLEYETSL